MYNGEYDKESVTLKEELGRKRFDKENCEAILYTADYYFENKEVADTRVVKFVNNNGNTYHGILSGIRLGEKSPNNLDKYSSTDDFYGSGEFWCPETLVPDNEEENPCEIYIDGKCVNEKGLSEWEKEKELEAEEAATNEAIERRYKYEQEYDKRFEEIEESIENTTSDNVKNADNQILKSPPPPVIDGVSIQINGIDDLSVHEAKNYIDLVVKKVQENARKNLSSITVTKQEDGRIKLDYAIQHEKFERIRRITGYLVGTMDKWNNAKRAEESERVKHLAGEDNMDANDVREKNEALEKITNSAMDGKISWEEADKLYYAEHLKFGDFKEALFNLYSGNPSISEEQSLDFMKDVVKIYGTNSQKLNDAVTAVADFNGESYAGNLVKLLNNAKNTDEYRNALKAVQGKEQEHLVKQQNTM